MPITKAQGTKDGKQKYRVRVSYKDENGQQKQIERTAYGRAEALLKEQEMLVLLKETSSPKMTVQKLYDEYMISKKREVRESSYEKSKNRLEHHVIPIMGQKKLTDLTVSVLQHWKNTIADKDLAISTSQGIFKEFSAMLNYAEKMNYIQKNNLRLVGNFREAYFTAPEEKLRYYTAEQFKAFIEVAKSHAEENNEWGYYIFFMIAFFTGMRKGEIHALKWSDIDNDIIHVRRSLTQKLIGEDRETPPKNRSSCRDIQIPNPLICALKAHKERQKKSSNFTDNFRVCGGEMCLRDNNITNRNVMYAKEAGLPHIRIHDFRHSHASLLANEGINIQEIARRLGHADVKMTWDRYAHLYPREEERAVEVLNHILNP
ncbi:MAG: site-specific integrase [Clostridiales bacterium]|nr:site-specific integrase [Clostridiales bacterium]